MPPSERPRKDQLREHVSSEILSARQDVVQQQTILRELNIKIGTARKNLKLANERLSKATLHLQQVENGTYQAPLFGNDGEAMPRTHRKIPRGIGAAMLSGSGPQSQVPS